MSSRLVLGCMRIAEAAPGAELRLSRPEWYRLFTAAGYALP